MRYKSLPFLLFIAFALHAGAQAPRRTLGAGEIQQQIKHLQVLGTVLYVAAHPDDENTRLIAYLSQGRGYETTYLSLTRGDGGQNVIGDEKGPLLGVLRTQELLAARRIDGGQQLFSRAYDFGYSKTPEETLDLWGNEKILADVVWAIRKVRPDVIVTRFLGPEGDKPGLGGHGHHIASAMLTKEAFRLAADPQAFPDQLRFVDPWQAKRVLWNGFSWGRTDEYDFSQTLKLDVGGYDPLLGKSYGEIAAESRSQHKCQAFGTGMQRGSSLEYLVHTTGEQAQSDLFDGINTRWERVQGGKKIEKLLEKAYRAFNPESPETVIPLLAEAWRAMTTLPDQHWVRIKKQALAELIAQCAGLWFEANSETHFVAPGDTARTMLYAIKRSPYPVSVVRASIDGAAVAAAGGYALATNDQPLQAKHARLMENTAPSQPYWLRQPVGKGSFQVSMQEWIGLPENPPAMQAQFTFAFGGEDPLELSYETPVVHKYVDRAVGELYRPFVVAPRVAVNFDERAYLFGQHAAQRIPVLIKSFASAAKGRVEFRVPPGWQAEPASLDFDLSGAGQEMRAMLTITPPEGQSIGVLEARVHEAGRPQTAYRQQTIAYEHIPPQLVFDPSEARLVRVAVEKEGDLVAYIMGSGDEIPAALGGIGYRVQVLEDKDISLDKLKQFDAVIAGIRAYNTRERMPYHHDQLMAYVAQGGTYIVQYNTAYDLKVPQPGPYPIKISSNRVTVEDAPVRILKPEHPVFHSPNEITEADFEGWIQERGLYFPGEWDAQYEALLEAADPGEKPSQGALLAARYGEGHFVYTGLSFFRELPAGVPGAYRLFANMISLGKTPKPETDSQPTTQGSE